MTESNEKTVAEHLWQYALAHSDLQTAAKQVRELLSNKLSDSGTDFQKIESRAKDILSYDTKAKKRLANKSKKYENPPMQITDTVATRIIVYTTSARATARELIRSTFTITEEHNPGLSKRNGYDSDHFIVSGFLDPHTVSGYGELKKFFETRPGLEIQVRTVAGHAWAEYEHDIRYKPGNGFHSLPMSAQKEIGQLFFEAGGFRRILDEAFDKIEEILRPSLAESPSGLSDEQTSNSAFDPDEELESELPSETMDDGISREGLEIFLKTKYPESIFQSDSNLEYELHALAALGFDTILDLEKALDSVDSKEIATLMGYKEDPDAGRRLEDDLLARFGEEYITRLGVSGQSKLNLEGRLRRVRGKTLIYSLDNIPELEGKFFTASQLFRELAKVVSRTKKGAKYASVEGLSSTRRTDLDASARPRELRVYYGKLWVATNRSRDLLEQGSAELAQKYPSRITLRRAGDIFFPESRTEKS